VRTNYRKCKQVSKYKTYIAPKSIKESGHVGWWVARGWGKLTGKSES